MSGQMNEWCASLYQTGMSETEKTAAAEEQGKLEALEMFAKVAADNNVDLTSLTQEQIMELYTDTMTKQAAGFPFPPKGEEKKEDKKDDDKDKKDEKDEDKEKEAAAAAHVAKSAEFQEKVAEADLMGRVMAHSLTQELELIKQASAAAAAPAAPAAPAAAPAVDEKTAAAHAFEELAARKGIEMAKEAGLDETQITNLVSAQYTLGLKETEKTAGISDLQKALEIRGLEYLDAVGVEVNWDQLGK